MAEKSLKDLGDKVDASTKGNVENEISKVKKAMESEDAEAIKAATESLTQARLAARRARMMTMIATA